MGSKFNQKVERIEAQLDAVVDNGNDEELFIASYLHGHLSLVVSQVMQRQANQQVDMQIETLDNALKTSLNNAFDNKELEPQDQIKVRHLWEQLMQQ